LRLVSPTGRIRSERQHLADLDARLNRAMQNRIGTIQQKLAAQSRALDLANPKNLLARGYAIVTRAMDGKRLTEAIDAAPGTSINIQLAQGNLTATVKDRKLDEEK
jgi:exodeoxyribonuclease VII large subunit